MKCDDMVGAANRRAGPGFEPPVIGLGDSVTQVGASSDPGPLLKSEPALTESNFDSWRPSRFGNLASTTVPRRRRGRVIATTPLRSG